MKQNKEEKRQNIHYIILESFFISFTLFIFGILEIFFTIRNEVWFDIGHIAGITLLMFVGSFFACFLLELLCCKLLFKVYTWVATLMVAVTTALYIQGNFLFSNFGVLDGGEINWNAHQVSNVISIIFWVFMLLVSLLIRYKIGFDKFKKATTILMRCVLLVQMVTLTTLMITTDGMKIKKDNVVTTENEFQYSSNRNMIILMLDHFDSRAFDYILKDSEGNDYEGVFEDFTYYPNTIGNFNRTRCALPHILTGQKYDNSGLYEDYINKAYLNSPLFERLRQDKYTIQIFTDDKPPSDEKVCKIVKNFKGAEGYRLGISSKQRMMEYLCKLVGFRYLPQPLKRYCWFYTDELMDLRDYTSYEPYSWANRVFDSKLQQISVDTEENMFNFYQLSGTHTPHLVADEEGNSTIVVGRLGEISDARFTLTVVEHYLEQLKKNDIYHNSIIVIMADHGGDFEFEDKYNFRRENPLFIVKGFQEKHEFARSEAPISYDDLQDAYQALLNGKAGSEIFSAKEGDIRERHFITEEDFTEYVTYGHAFDYNAMQPVKDKRDK